jgi:hypothetical protein
MWKTHGQCKVNSDVNKLCCYASFSFGGNQLLSLKFHPQMVTRIQHLQTPISSLIVTKIFFQRAQTIQLVKKLTCEETLQEAHAHAQVRNVR